MEPLMDSSDLQVLAWRLFEESNDAVFVLDPATETIQQANPAAQRLTGLRWRQLRGRRLDDLVHGDHADRTSSLMTAVRETGFFHSQEEYLLVRHNSAPLAINLSVSRVHTPSGLLRLVVARDVSKRKETERALRDFGDELASQVHRQTEELRAANTQLTREIEERESAQRALQESNQQLRAAISQLEAARAREVKRERLHALEQIAGGIAHDINNSLAAVISFAELILKQEIPKETRRQAENIQTAGRDIAAIVRRMRQFYSDPSDQEASQAIELVQLAEDAVQLSRPKWH
jgi:PAS domain S-box-containing protein